MEKGHPTSKTTQHHATNHQCQATHAIAPRLGVGSRGLCGQDNLTDEQRGRLARFASALGVAAPADGDLCAALEEASGTSGPPRPSRWPSWSRKRGVEKSREMLSEMRSQRVRRGFFGTPQVEQPDEVPSEIWSALPPELQPVVVEQLVRTNPRMAILLSETVQRASTSSPTTGSLLRRSTTRAPWSRGGCASWTMRAWRRPWASATRSASF
ncbi:hypothetical protein pclt_cds_1187 [Pandoravirus celtis]|uniref:Uncharacterized protein n=1 Tax=Pandoravirus celtis TaxID=2568002 RepID=A0A4D6EJ72_9VIRU|nr:hypothetical protein pclt_cds_1187 [Pandoravirus celtis]